MQIILLKNSSLLFSAEPFVDLELTLGKSGLADVALKLRRSADPVAPFHPPSYNYITISVSYYILPYIIDNF